MTENQLIELVFNFQKTLPSNKHGAALRKCKQKRLNKTTKYT